MKNTNVEIEALILNNHDNLEALKKFVKDNGFNVCKITDNDADEYFMNFLSDFGGILEVANTIKNSNATENSFLIYSEITYLIVNVENISKAWGYASLWIAKNLDNVDTTALK